MDTLFIGIDAVERSEAHKRLRGPVEVVLGVEELRRRHVSGRRRGFVVVVLDKGVLVRVLLPIAAVVVLPCARRTVTLVVGVTRLPGHGVRRRPRRTGEGRLLRQNPPGRLREMVLGGTMREIEMGIWLAVPEDVDDEEEEEGFLGVGVGDIAVGDCGGSGMDLSSD